jgi:hypothetical protein
LLPRAACSSAPLGARVTFSRASHSCCPKKHPRQSQQGLQSPWSLWFQIVQMAYFWPYTAAGRCQLLFSTLTLHCRHSGDFQSLWAPESLSVAPATHVAPRSIHPSHSRVSRHPGHCGFKSFKWRLFGLTLPPEDASSSSPRSHCTAVTAVTSSRSGRQSHFQSH